MFAWPLVGWHAIKYMQVSFLKIFYTDDYPKASLGLIAFFGVLGVLLDAFTDPLIASITDNTVTKWGRRRPYIFGSAFYTVAVAICTFMPPDSGAVVSGLWYGLFHIMYQLAD